MAVKIEAGKYYRTRDGQKMGPISRRKSVLYPWHDDSGGKWTKEGNFWHFGQESNLDLIAECTDPIDLTTIEKPFGLLDDATQVALRAYEGPIEYFGPSGWKRTPYRVFPRDVTHRAAPKPPGPRVRWIVGDTEAYASEADAREAAKGLMNLDIRRYVEVPE